MLTVVTPVCVVVSPTEEVVRLVDVLVDRTDVKVVVVIPATGPVTVLVVDVVPVIRGAFVVADRVVEPVTVENVEVVLAELVDKAQLVTVENEVVLVELVDKVPLEDV